MELSVVEEPFSMTKIYTIKFNSMEFSEAMFNLSDMDRAVIQDCDKPDATIADKLLALEIIARRIERK